MADTVATAPSAPRRDAPAGARTVREATFDVLRERGMTSIFSNPGSTEVAFLADLPADLRFVLALHEGSVVALATGYALGRGAPSFVLLHTTAGLGNAVGALATARVNRAPLVVVVGQQDRRHLAYEPFLTGRLGDLAGEYPVWRDEPARPQDVPGAIARAWHEATTRRGPALVIVPMDDWVAPADDTREVPAPTRLLRPVAADDESVDALVDLLDGAERPALVVGAGSDDAVTWAALTTLAERLGCPVWQESFGARAGFPQDHPQFAGNLPADRPRLRDVLAPHDVVLAVGAPVFRQFGYEPGPLVVPGTHLAMVSDEPDEAHRSPVELAVLGSIGAIVGAVAERVADRSPDRAPALFPVPPAPQAPGVGEPLRAGHVLAALAERLPPEAIVVEETPSSRPELERRLRARRPMGMVTAAMGGLGFALPGATGLRLARPDRPVVAVVGDGSSLYQVQALWSAARYEVGALFVILVNGGYAIMDHLAERRGGAPPWPRFDNVDLPAVARGLGCKAELVADHETLIDTLDAVIPTLAGREEPLVLAVAIDADADYQP